MNYFPAQQLRYGLGERKTMIDSGAFPQHLDVVLKGLNTEDMH